MSQYPQNYGGGYNQPPPPGMYPDQQHGMYPPPQPQPYYPPPQPAVCPPGGYYPQQPPTQTIVMQDKPQKKDNCLRDCFLCAICMTLCCWCCTD